MESTRSALTGYVLPIVVTLVLGGAYAVHSWPAHPHWTTSDSLFYEANVLRARGVDKAAALRTVFGGPLAEPLRETERGLSPADRRITNPAWISFSSKFYERRWLVPLLAAPLVPKAKDKALSAVSLFGFALCGPAFFLLLRRRFSATASFVGACVGIFFFPLRYWSAFPLTDSFGVALEAAALLFGSLTVQRGLRYLPGWIVSVTLLSFTRDAAVVAVFGAVWLSLRTRMRSAVTLAFSGIVAAASAPLIFHSPLREQLAYVIARYRVPHSTSWEYVFRHYPSAVSRFIRADESYLAHHLLTGVFLGGGLLLFFSLVRSRAPLDRFLRGAGCAAAAYLLILPNYTAFRLELVFVPFMALGFAAGLEWLGGYLAVRRAGNESLASG